ncbi:cell wall-associated NlpC family hydrolase [Krasilnikovia cinnamomea]|uniref:Cell wall-associated NlpC family hydrolase n=1 Tax=Krasilnikovia cinnamomea TaxID=349313 RepID=A0A4Q7ZEF2_9ACTN|nr:C40 family peptidase [Krasilnikovia cinnamomea]RZU49038.1 cell wall-associated NlpC family hydrolase [Krasilnikovia cinnamomea]
MSHSHPPVLRRLALFGLAAALVTTVTLGAAAPSPAAADSRAAGSHATAAQRAAKARAAQARAVAAAKARGLRIVAFAKAQKGKPYRLGAGGPKAFDCSGLAGYVYRKAQLKLGRTANAQFHQVRRLAKAQRRPGDLVFWVRGGHAYHVAVYAGQGKVWHAPKPGSRVKLAAIFEPGRVRYGRIGV